MDITTQVLSIVIVNWNAEGFLKDCLNSIYKSCKLKLEVFVVDNSSSDKSMEVLENEFPQVKIIKNKENLGFARANNQAIKQSRGRYVLMLNPDTIVLPNALDIMVEFMDEHTEAGACGPKLLNPDGSLQPSCRSFPTLLTTLFEETLLNRIFPKNRVIGEYRMGYWDHGDIWEVDQPMGSALMVRREAIEQVGLLDEQFFIYYEEVDWCYRMKKRSWKVFFLPQAQIIHYGGASCNQDRGINLMEMYRSLIKFFRKHYGQTSVILLRFLIVYGLLLRTFIFSILYLLSREQLEARQKLKACLAVFREAIR
ncbi:MAG: glycosyltransferase family 2 protein [bacterium]|nr:glycosyltransferase family 2 protein [bacterium]